MDELAKTEILELERGLLNPLTRHLPEWLDRILAEDMVEFGKSGQIYSKSVIVQALAAEPRSVVPRHQIVEPKLTELAPDTMLLTYRLEPLVRDSSDPLIASLRSSIWLRRDDRWQLFFHQGTAIG